MIRSPRASRSEMRLDCHKCGGDHLGSDCKFVRSDAPMERPPANGEYLGSATVRVIPTGVAGTESGLYGDFGAKAAIRSALKGRDKQHRQSILRGAAKGGESMKRSKRGDHANGN